MLDDLVERVEGALPNMSRRRAAAFMRAVAKSIRDYLPTKTNLN